MDDVWIPVALMLAAVVIIPICWRRVDSALAGFVNVAAVIAGLIAFFIIAIRFAKWVWSLTW